jgi:hypothetical protein
MLAFLLPFFPFSFFSQGRLGLGALARGTPRTFSKGGEKGNYSL